MTMASIQRVVRHFKTHTTDLVKKLSHPSYTWEIAGANPVVGIGGLRDQQAEIDRIQAALKVRTDVEDALWDAVKQLVLIALFIRSLLTKQVQPK